MVTGGDALVETNAAPEKFNAKLNGQDIAKSFRPGKTTGTLTARVEGLKLGKNTLEVKSAKGSAKLELTNFPITGPRLFGTASEAVRMPDGTGGLGRTAR